jgi:glycosyltransferase involved in cell wall biosynthesis
MKLAIIGTRGIPNNYGGFEQISEELSLGLCARGYEVSVYCSHNHPYKEKTWNGIERIACYDAERHLKTVGQFIYDLNCIRDARKRNFDVLLFMGYTSSSVWGRWFPKNALVISNMDGLEWKRDKYPKPIQAFLKQAEKLAIIFSQHHIADSIAIKDHIDKKYGISSSYIPYGAKTDAGKNEEVLNEYGLVRNGFDMLLARMEPENNIDMILEGYAGSAKERTMLVVGNTDNTYGKKIRNKYRHVATVLFTGRLFNQEKLNSLREACHLYFHGHSVGGTNPSLLEAMASGALIAAHENIFNKSILGIDGFYFQTADHVVSIMNSVEKQAFAGKIAANLEKIERIYNWEKVVDQYDQLIRKSFNQFRQ